MAILTKVKKPKKATDQQTEAPAHKAPPPSKQAPISAPVPPNMSDEAPPIPKRIYAPQRPSNLRTSSSAPVKPMPTRPLMSRTAASEPNLGARGRINRNSSDLSIDSVMMSHNENPSPNGRMVLHTRQADFKPTMYTYDPSKAPNLAGRKRQYRSCHSHPSTRASSFVRSPHISTMVEETEEVEEQADSSSSSTVSNSSNSSTHSREIQALIISDQKIPNPVCQTEYLVQQQDVAPPAIPPRNPARNSVASWRTSVTSTHDIKRDSAVDSSTITPARGTPATLSTAEHRTESPGPKSKRRNWFNRKHTTEAIST